MSPAEVERQREKIMRAPLVVTDKEYRFPRTSLSTRLEQWTRILGFWLWFLPSMKCCFWAKIMNWCTSSGCSLLCLLSESMWMLHGHATRSWFSISICPVLSTSSLCIQFVACFGPSFSMGCILGLCPVASIGQCTRELRRGVRGTRPKSTDAMRQKWTSKWLIPRRCINININKRSINFSIRGN